MSKKSNEYEDNRYCADDEIFVCPHCGKNVKHDRYDFKSPSCMLNAVKVKEAFCTFDSNGLVTKVESQA